MAGDETVAILGAGSTMGLPMARNLLAAGIAVRAWNRSAEKAEPLKPKGAEVLGSPAQAASGATVIITMLADADAVMEAMDGEQGAAGSAAADAIWLQMSTIGERGTVRCQDLASAHGLRFVDAPVLGTKEPAEQGKLVVLASGPEELKPRLQPVFDAFGRRTMWVGAAGAGSRLKLATNCWVLTVVEGAAETIALTEGLGLDPALLLEAVDGGPLDLPYLRMKGKAMIERNFEPSFQLKLAAKDARLMEESARDHDIELPLVSAIRQQLERGVDEHGDKDVSATYLVSAGRR